MNKFLVMALFLLVIVVVEQKNTADRLIETDKGLMETVNYYYGKYNECLNKGE